jgi:hypothetical protein
MLGGILAQRNLISKVCKQLAIFIEMPKEVKMLLKAANIKKRHLKNEEMAMKTFEIIQKAFSSHTHSLMDLFKKRRKSTISK